MMTGVDTDTLDKVLAVLTKHKVARARVGELEVEFLPQVPDIPPSEDEMPRFPTDPSQVRFR